MKKYKVLQSQTLDFSIGDIVELSDEQAAALVNKVELYVKSKSAETSADAEAIAKKIRAEADAKLKDALEKQEADFKLQLQAALEKQAAELKSDVVAPPVVPVAPPVAPRSR